MSGEFQLHTLKTELCLFLALDRFDRVSELCFTTDDQLAQEKLSQVIEELSIEILGLDLGELSQFPFKQKAALNIEIISCLDELIFQFRHGGAVKNLKDSAFEKSLMCPCHSLTTDSLIRSLKKNPNPTLRELQAELGIGVGCDSCLGVCQSFCRDYVAAHRLHPKPFPVQMKLQGMGQAQLALAIQDYLNEQHPGIKVLSFKGFDLRLSERSLSMEEALRARFEINFRFEEEACRP